MSIKKNKQAFLFCLTIVLLIEIASIAQTHPAIKKQPNILFAISDDQSYPHASAYGQKVFHTPAFDSIASKGVLFNNAFAAAPQCSPSRAAILTGRQIWQLEEAGTHASSFPKKFPVFTNALEANGYFIGFTGKPWAPGNFAASGWSRNPVGPEYNKEHLTITPTSGISNIDYVSNFKKFLLDKPADKPFFFWFGANEPHREYEEGSGISAGLLPKDILVPKFLPDNDLTKSDMLDYALEIEWFDSQLRSMLRLLKEAGELDNTIVIVTSDNGMPFPYAKANLQEYGSHVPLAICGPMIRSKNRKVEDLVSLIDIAPTILDLSHTTHFEGITGKTLLPILNSIRSGKIDTSRNFVLTGRERHSHARPDNLGYPARAIRTDTYLYIENFKPDRWPLGDPAPKDQTPILGNKDMKPILEGYEDIDDSPSKTFMIKNQSLWPDLFHLGFEKRGSEELYDIKNDPYCLHDLSASEKFQSERKKLKDLLESNLSKQADPRMTAYGNIFDSYPRYGLMRPFSGFKERGKYNTAIIKN